MIQRRISSIRAVWLIFLDETNHHVADRSGLTISHFIFKIVLDLDHQICKSNSLTEVIQVSTIIFCMKYKLLTQIIFYCIGSANFIVSVNCETPNPFT